MKTDTTYQFLLNVIYAIFLLGIIPAIIICALLIFLIFLCGAIYALPYVVFVGVSVWALKKCSK